MQRGAQRGALVVPFNRPHRTGREEALLSKALDTGMLAGDGPFSQEASGRISDLVGGGRCMLTTSCTHALEMSAMLLDLEPGDEVIVPSFTFVTVANAFVLRGAVPVFVDVRRDTFNLDEELVEAAITPRTRAVVAVHYGGVACALDELAAVCARHGLTLIEDNAHGLGGRYRGRPLGSVGRIATQSFHATKNVQCGEGGALVLNDLDLIDRAEVVREKGTDRSRFHRGQTDKYTWRDVGSSYLISDLLAAVLCAQLAEFDEIQSARTRVWNWYAKELAGWRADNGIDVQAVPDDCEHPAHLYALLMPSTQHRDRLIAHLARHGVMATFHYLPLDSSPGGLRYGRPGPGGCPTTELVATRLVRLPLFSQMSDDDIETVVRAVLSFRA